MKRYLKGFEEYGDLYEAIKSGKKTVEYRDASDHWWNRLIEKRAKLLGKFYRGRNMVFQKGQLKHDKAVFVVGYTKYPRLVADITKIIYLYDSNQFEVHIKNVKEEHHD